MSQARCDRGNAAARSEGSPADGRTERGNANFSPPPREVMRRPFFFFYPPVCQFGRSYEGILMGFSGNGNNGEDDWIFGVGVYSVLSEGFFFFFFFCRWMTEQNRGSRGWGWGWGDGCRSNCWCFQRVLEQQGTVAQRPIVRKTIRAFRGNQARTGWLISSAPVALEAGMKTEEGEGGEEG